MQASAIQRPARFLFLENSREFFFYFHFSFSISSHFISRVKLFNFSLFTSRKEWKLFVFHLFSREKRVKSGAGYNLTSIFVPNCISKNCQISSKHQPQNIGQISISKSWPNPVLQVWTKHQLKKSDKKFNLDILTKLQLLYQTVVNTFLIHIDMFSVDIFAYQSHISQVWNWETDKAM